MFELRPYQTEAIDRVRAAMRLHPRVLLALATGAGKTVTGAEIVRRCVGSGLEVLWLAHRAELVDQAAATLTRFGLTVGSISASAQTPPNPFAQVQVATIQTLLARNIRPKARFIVNDECVSPDTIVGGKRADEICVGDDVEAWDGTAIVMRRVARVFVNFAHTLRELSVGGKRLTVTDTHPIWVEGKGYVNADQLQVGDMCRVQRPDAEVRPRQHANHVLAGVLSCDPQEATAATAAANVCVRQSLPATSGSHESCRLLADNMLGRVQAREGVGYSNENEPRSRFIANEEEQSDGASGRAISPIADTSEDWASSTMGRRARPRCHEAASNIVVGAGSGLDCRISDVDEDGFRTARVHLQRPCERGDKACDRGGREHALRRKGAGSGCAQDRVSELNRVDGIEVFERGSDGTFGGRCPNGLVYNFEVDGEHNFFANGVLTHNCHHSVADLWSTLYDSYPGVRVLGLTATPERSDGRGLDSQFDALVTGATVRELTEIGALVPCEVLRPDRYLSSGEMAQHPVDAFVAHAANRPTIMFARGVELAQQYADEFNMRGIKAGCVHGDAPWSERAMYLDAFRAGRIQVLVNVFVLTEGFDAPETSCVILGRGCSTAGTYLQMVGRALRPAAGKKDALILDLRGVSHEFGRPDEDRVFSLDGKGIRLKNSVIFCPVCGAEREAGEGCASCGWQPAGEPTKGDKVTGDPLVKFAAKRAENEDDRIATLGRWLALARAKGHKEGAALHKFKAVYGTWPTADVIRRARGGVAA